MIVAPARRAPGAGYSSKSKSSVVKSTEKRDPMTHCLKMPPMYRLAPAILAAWTASIVVAHAGGDPARGKQLFEVCASCHAIGPHAIPMLGPPLNGIVGRVWGSWPHYSYSAGIVAGHNAGKVWDDTALNRWLAAPQQLVPGTTMIFSGLEDPQQRADIIAYLRQFKRDGSQR